MAAIQPNQYVVQEAPQDGGGGGGAMAKQSSIDPKTGLGPDGEGVKVKLDGLRPETRAALAAFDADGDGVEVHEIIQAAEKWKASKGDMGSFDLKAFPAALQETLTAFDHDGDGTVSKVELAQAAKMFADSKREAKRLRMAVVALFVILVFTVMIIFGLTFAVVELSKETKVETSGVTTVSGSDTPAGTAKVIKMVTLSDLSTMSAQEAGNLEMFTLDLPGGGQASYKVDYVKKRATMLVGLQGGGRLEIINASVGKLTETGTNVAKTVCLQTGGCPDATIAQYHRHQVMGRRTHTLSDGTPSTSMGSCSVQSAATFGSGSLPDAPLCAAGFRQCSHPMPSFCVVTPPAGSTAGSDPNAAGGAPTCAAPPCAASATPPPPPECQDCDPQTMMCHKCIDESWGACPGTPGGPTVPECNTAAAPQLCHGDAPDACTGSDCYGTFYCAMSCPITCPSGQTKCHIVDPYFATMTAAGGLAAGAPVAAPTGHDACVPAARGCPPTPPVCPAAKVLCTSHPSADCPDIDGFPCWDQYKCFPNRTGCPPPPLHCPSGQKICTEPPPAGMSWPREFCHPAGSECPAPPVFCNPQTQHICSGLTLAVPGPDFCMPHTSPCPMPAGAPVALTATQAAQDPGYDFNNSAQFRRVWHIRRAKAQQSAAVAQTACDPATEDECMWPAASPTESPTNFCAPRTTGCPPAPVTCNISSQVLCTADPPAGCMPPGCFSIEYCMPIVDGCPPMPVTCSASMGLVPCHVPPPPGCQHGCYGYDFCAQSADGCPPLPLQCNVQTEVYCTGAHPPAGGPAPEWCAPVAEGCAPPVAAIVCASYEVSCPGPGPNTAKVCMPATTGCPPPPPMCTQWEIECHSMPPPGCTMGACMPPAYCMPNTTGCPVHCASGMHMCHEPPPPCPPMPPCTTTPCPPMPPCNPGPGHDYCLPDDQQCPISCMSSEEHCTDQHGMQTCAPMDIGCAPWPVVCASGQTLCSEPADPHTCKGCWPHEYCVTPPQTCPPPPLYCASHEQHCYTCTACPCYGEGAAPRVEQCISAAVGCPMDPPCCSSSQIICSLPAPPPPPYVAGAPPMPTSMMMPMQFCADQSTGCPKPPLYCASNKKPCTCPTPAPPGCVEQCVGMNAHCPVYCNSNQHLCTDHVNGGDYCFPMTTPCMPPPLQCAASEVKCWTHCTAMNTCACPAPTPTPGSTMTPPMTYTCACPCNPTEYCHMSATGTCPSAPNVHTAYPVTMYPMPAVTMYPATARKEKDK